MVQPTYPRRLNNAASEEEEEKTLKMSEERKKLQLNIQDLEEQLEEEEAVPYLTAMGEDDDIQVQLSSIRSLGKIGDNFKQNNWFFNTAQSYDILSITLVDNVNKTYRVTTKDSAILRYGDYVRITYVDDFQLDARLLVTDVFNNTSFLIRGQGLTDLSIIKKVTRQISKVDSDLHGNLNNYTANVQNTYIDGEDVLVASNSLPSVSLFPTALKDKS